MIQTLFIVLSLVCCLLSQGLANNITVESAPNYAKALLLRNSISGNGVLSVELTTSGKFRLIAADTNTVTVSQYDPANFVFTTPPYQLTTAPTNVRTLTGFNKPRSIWSVGSGVYAIADTLNFCVHKYDYINDQLTVLAGQSGVNGNDGDGGNPTAATMWSPFAGDYESSTQIHFVADLHACLIRTIDVSNSGSPIINTFYGSFRQCKNDVGFLNKPTGVVATGSNIYVTEKDANRIVRINRSSKARITVIGDTGVAAYTPDGSSLGADATIIRPVCYYRKNNIDYFCEKNNIRIKTTTYAGTNPVVPTNTLSTLGPLDLGHTRGIFVTSNYAVIADSLRQQIVLTQFPPQFDT